MTLNTRKNSQRRGIVLQETAMAMLLITAAIAGACQLLHGVATQRRDAEYRHRAALELANVLEDLLSRRWEELKSQTPAVEISKSTRQRLPEPKLQIAIDPNADDQTLRVRVEMDWQVTPDRRSQPLRLVAWKYPPLDEEQP